MCLLSALKEDRFLLLTLTLVRIKVVKTQCFFFFPSILVYSLSHIFNFGYDHLMINLSICDVICSCLKPVLINFWQIQNQWDKLFQSNTKHSEMCFCCCFFFPPYLKQKQCFQKKIKMNKETEAIQQERSSSSPAQSWIRDLILDLHGEAAYTISRLQGKLLSKPQQICASAAWKSWLQKRKK